MPTFFRLLCSLSVRAGALLAGLAGMLLPMAAEATNVRLQTTLGAIDIELFDSAAPRTVANFLAYSSSGAYNNTFIHRSIPGFVIQGGGYAWDGTRSIVVAIPTNPPIVNEFNVSRSNVRGTIAMAKLSGDPNSATSQWFINLGNNASSLDTQNGGFTVFGQVTPRSMAVVDAIAALITVNAGGAFTDLPLASLPTGNNIVRANLVMIDTAATIAANYQGLWWNTTESGWGMSVTQHGSTIFVALYTYDETGQPVWYVITNCPVTGTRCTGDLYRVAGGTGPTQTWSASGLATTKVGTGTLSFADALTANVSLVINGTPATKSVTRQTFATGNTAPQTDYTDLWWNERESGWGVALTQQYGTLFAAWYTYDASGKAIWYIASNCPIIGTGCTGELFQVTNGTPLTVAWNGTRLATTKVGTITFAFSDAGNATMSYTINGASATRAITRIPF